MGTMTDSLRQYLATALWSSTGEDGNPLDNDHGLDDFAAEAITQAEADWQSFQDKAGSLLDGFDLSTVAHDFWLTRNRHGAGFWDGDYPKSLGEALTELSHSFGELSPYVGDDGKIYLI